MYIHLILVFLSLKTEIFEWAGSGGGGDILLLRIDLVPSLLPVVVVDRPTAIFI